ncbi:hypothetical protein PCL_03894 [Purpureocillium lilacinum]|uniref:Uncharacterized protein n=1 Tax=Purpureocillium lilacinum TaxID=33203 RepID=A0A2U3EQE8_PURLI|nr:hypothetical protein PCL_03894 [Purpureocillium lilacinum]
MAGSGSLADEPQRWPRRGVRATPDHWTGTPAGGRMTDSTGVSKLGESVGRDRGTGRIRVGGISISASGKQGQVGGQGWRWWQVVAGGGGGGGAKASTKPQIGFQRAGPGASDRLARVLHPYRHHPKTRHYARCTPRGALPAVEPLKRPPAKPSRRIRPAHDDAPRLSVAAHGVACTLVFLGVCPRRPLAHCPSVMWLGPQPTTASGLPERRDPASSNHRRHSMEKSDLVCFHEGRYLQKLSTVFAGHSGPPRHGPLQSRADAEASAHQHTPSSKTSRGAVTGGVTGSRHREPSPGAGRQQTLTRRAGLLCQTSNTGLSETRPQIQPPGQRALPKYAPHV